MAGSPWKWCLLETHRLSDGVTWAHILIPKSFLLERLCLASLSPKGRLFPGARSLLFCQTWQETSVVVSLRWSWKTSTRSFEQFSHSWKHLAVTSSGFRFLSFPFFSFLFLLQTVLPLRVFFSNSGWNSSNSNNTWHSSFQHLKNIFWSCLT